jgi:NAD(P)-dependent dehydrogenase (short-subunit alcohol dehydrogenase family)
MTEAPTIFITGATDGLGRALAGRLAADGATLILHGRDAGRLESTAAEISATHGVDHPQTVRADLADLAQVRKLALDVQNITGRLDVFVSNAGIGSGMPDGRERRTSADGYELRFAVNYLAGYALTRLLLPLLRASAPSRIVNVASIGQQPIDFSDVMLTKDYDGARAYRQSKLAQILFTFDLAAELDPDGVTVNALHPATFMPTKIVDSPISTIAQGVEATMRLIAAPDTETGTGRFYNSLDEGRPNDQAYDLAARRQLREVSERLTGL